MSFSARNGPPGARRMRKKVSVAITHSVGIIISTRRRTRVATSALRHVIVERGGVLQIGAPLLVGQRDLDAEVTLPHRLDGLGDAAMVLAAIEQNREPREALPAGISCPRQTFARAHGVVRLPGRL